MTDSNTIGRRGRGRLPLGVVLMTVGVWLFLLLNLGGEKMSAFRTAGTGGLSLRLHPARDWTPELRRLVRQILDQARSLG